MAAPAENEEEPGRFTSLSWHPERPLHLLLTTSSWFHFPESANTNIHLDGTQNTSSSGYIHGTHLFLILPHPVTPALLPW